MSPMLYEYHVFAIATIGDNDTSIQGEKTHPLLSLQTVVTLRVVGQGRGDKRGSLIQALVALLGHACLALCCVLLHLRPQRLIGRADLPGDTTGHLSRYLEASTYLIVGAILQADLVAHLAVLKGIATDIVQAVTIGQLGRSQRFELCRIGLQFELSGHGYFHHLSIIT